VEAQEEHFTRKKHDSDFPHLPEIAGVHYGDATLVLPPAAPYLETVRRIRRISSRIQLAQCFVEALSKMRMAELQIKSWHIYGAPELAPIRMPQLSIPELMRSGGMTA
jgi:hypothetical protein